MKISTGEEVLMREKCDMCGSKIIDNECDCGTWKSKEEMENDPMKLTIEQFNEMKRFTMTGYAPHLVCAVKVQKFIYEMKGRPFYE